MARPALWLRALSRYRGDDLARAQLRLRPVRATASPTPRWRASTSPAGRRRSTAPSRWRRRCCAPSSSASRRWGFRPRGADAGLRPVGGGARRHLLGSRRAVPRPALRPRRRCRASAAPARPRRARRSSRSAGRCPASGCGSATRPGATLPEGRVGRVWTPGPVADGGLPRRPGGHRPRPARRLARHRRPRLPHERRALPDRPRQGRGDPARPQPRAGGDRARGRGRCRACAPAARSPRAGCRRTPRARCWRSSSRPPARPPPDERAALPDACRAAVLGATGLAVDRVVVLAPGTLPRTSSGKLRRQEALRLYLAGDADGARAGDAAAPGRRRWRAPASLSRGCAGGAARRDGDALELARLPDRRRRPGRARDGDRRAARRLRGHRPRPRRPADRQGLRRGADARRRGAPARARRRAARRSPFRGIRYIDGDVVGRGASSRTPAGSACGGPSSTRRWSDAPRRWASSCAGESRREGLGGTAGVETDQRDFRGALDRGRRRPALAGAALGRARRRRGPASAASACAATSRWRPGATSSRSTGGRRARPTSRRSRRTRSASPCSGAARKAGFRRSSGELPGAARPARRSARQPRGTAAPAPCGSGRGPSTAERRPGRRRGGLSRRHHRRGAGGGAPRVGGAGRGSARRRSRLYAAAHRRINRLPNS